MNHSMRDRTSSSHRRLLAELGVHLEPKDSGPLESFRKEDPIVGPCRQDHDFVRCSQICHYLLLQVDMKNLYRFRI